jgi:hypothetical protein
MMVVFLLLKNNYMKKDSDRYFRTSSFSLAAFLFANSEQIAGVNETEERGKKEFCFVMTDRLEELVDLYKFGDRNDPDLLVHVHTYEQGRRELLDRLKD